VKLTHKKYLHYHVRILTVLWMILSLDPALICKFCLHVHVSNLHDHVTVLTWVVAYILTCAKIPNLHNGRHRCRKLRMGEVAWSPVLADCWSKIDAWGALVKVCSGKMISSRLLQRLLKKANMQGMTNISLSQAKSNLKMELQHYHSLKKWSVQLCESFLELLAWAQAKEKGVVGN